MAGGRPCFGTVMRGRVRTSGRQYPWSSSVTVWRSGRSSVTECAGGSWQMVVSVSGWRTRFSMRQFSMLRRRAHAYRFMRSGGGASTTASLRFFIGLRPLRRGIFGTTVAINAAAFFAFFTPIVFLCGPGRLRLPRPGPAGGAGACRTGGREAGEYADRVSWFE